MMENEADFSIASLSTSNSRNKFFSTSDSENDSVFSISYPSSQTATKAKADNKKLIILLVYVISMLLFVIAASLLSVAAITIYRLEEKAVEEIVMELDNVNVTDALADMQLEIDEIKQNITNLTKLVDDSQTQIEARVVYIINECRDHSTDAQIQTNYLQQQINENAGEISALELVVDSQTQEIELTQENLANLSNSITTRTANVSLYSDCYRRKESCSMPNDQPYWKKCSTPWILPDVQGYYITSMQCEYDSIYFGFHVTSILSRQEDNLARCSCSVIAPNANTGYSETLPVNYRGTCYMVISYCPSEDSLD